MGLRIRVRNAFAVVRREPHCGSEGGSLLYSMEAGSRQFGLAHANIHALAANGQTMPSQEGIRERIVRLTLAQVGPQLMPVWVTLLSVHFAHEYADTLFAGVEGGVYTSTNGGQQAGWRLTPGWEALSVRSFPAFREWPVCRREMGGCSCRPTAVRKLDECELRTGEPHCLTHWQRQARIFSRELNPAFFVRVTMAQAGPL